MMVNEKTANLFNRLSQGNPGAMHVLVTLMQRKDRETITAIDQSGKRGSEIWVVYKDECGENLEAFCEKIKEASEACKESLI